MDEVQVTDRNNDFCHLLKIYFILKTVRLFWTTLWWLRKKMKTFCFHYVLTVLQNYIGTSQYTYPTYDVNVINSSIELIFIYTVMWAINHYGQKFD
jgi:hypothetical protein